MTERLAGRSSGVEIRPFEGSSLEWDALAATHGSTFHSSAWLGVMESTQPVRLLRLGVSVDAAQVGILPLFVRRYLLFKVGASPMVIDNTPYLGIACPREHLGPAFRAAGRFAKRNGIHFLRLFQHEVTPPAPSDADLVHVEKHTHVIDLTQSSDDIWKKMHRNSRTGIRKAEKSGVTVVRETSRECIAPYYRILSALYAAQKMETPSSLEFYLRLWDQFSNRGLFVLTARYEGTMIAGAIFLRDRDRVYYLNGCSLAEFNHLVANRAIQWRAIQMAKEMGATTYDFVGSDIPRLAEFKGSFGGTLTPYSLIEFASSRWVASARVTYPRLRELAKHVRGRFRPARAAT